VAESEKNCIDETFTPEKMLQKQLLHATFIKCLFDSNNNT